MSGIQRLGALAARSLARRVFSPPPMHRRSFGAAALAEVEYWTEWEEEEHGRYAAAAATDACGEREPRRVQWVFMGSPGVQRHVYATRVAELLDLTASKRRRSKPRSAAIAGIHRLGALAARSLTRRVFRFLKLNVTKHLRTDGVEEEEIEAQVSRHCRDPPLRRPRSTIPRPAGVLSASYASPVLRRRGAGGGGVLDGVGRGPPPQLQWPQILAMTEAEEGAVGVHGESRGAAACVRHARGGAPRRTLHLDGLPRLPGAEPQFLPLQENQFPMLCNLRQMSFLEFLFDLWSQFGDCAVGFIPGLEHLFCAREGYLRSGGHDLSHCMAWPRNLRGVISSFSGNSCHCAALGFLKLNVTKHLRTDGVEEEEIEAQVSRHVRDPALGRPRSTIPRPAGVLSASYASPVLRRRGAGGGGVLDGVGRGPPPQLQWPQILAMTEAEEGAVGVHEEPLGAEACLSYKGWPTPSVACEVVPLHLQPLHDGWLPPFAVYEGWFPPSTCSSRVRVGHPPLLRSRLPPLLQPSCEVWPPPSNVCGATLHLLWASAIVVGCWGPARAIAEVVADGLEIANVVNEGRLVPEEIIFGLLSKRLEEGYQRGETGFILDGIPRTRIQAEILDQIANIDLVVNLQCPDDCLVKKHFGADICSHCGKTFDSSNSESTSLNLCLATRTRHAQLKSSAAVDMKDSCMEKFRVYSEQIKQLEEYYTKQKKLLDVQVTGGPGETWQGLLAALHLQHMDTATSQKLTA
ncbi:hypothetical protein C4D60_Mb10t22810 [Musa balbisiana]|uniref:adenylate kinase n=1 Tax=Musa balbisiana TaxID=52838 RepID=A0A4V4H507_MUSBA|nr:hypothetical protein C4D60_Mb10t22810 [Musa balbisiana]